MTIAENGRHTMPKARSTITRLDLGDEQWAEVYPADRIPYRQTIKYRKAYYRAMAPAMAGIDVDDGGTDEASAKAAGTSMMEEGALEDIASALVLAVVKEWSFGPVTIDVLESDDVFGDQIKVITDYCAENGHAGKLSPDFGPSPSTDSPTTPS